MYICGHNVGKRPTLGWLTQSKDSVGWSDGGYLRGLHPRKLTLN